MRSGSTHLVAVRHSSDWLALPFIGSDRRSPLWRLNLKRLAITRTVVGTMRIILDCKREVFTIFRNQSPPYGNATRKPCTHS